MKSLLIGVILTIILPLTSGVGGVSETGVDESIRKTHAETSESDVSTVDTSTVKSNSGLKSGNTYQSSSPTQQDSDIITIGSDSKDKWIEDNVGSDYTDEGVKLPDGSSLTDSDNEQIKEWVNKIKADESNASFTFMRVLRIFIGVILIVYSVLFYFAYWFDRINVIFDISLIAIISFGRFAVSDDENISTFKKDTNGAKLITHRDAVRISLIGFVLGALLVSSQLFNFLLTVYTKVKELISRG